MVDLRRIAGLTSVLLLTGALLAGIVYASRPTPSPAWLVVSGEAGVDPGIGVEDALGDAGLPARVERRRQSVLAALAAATSHPWAGEYFHGDGEGKNVAGSRTRRGCGEVVEWMSRALWR